MAAVIPAPAPAPSSDERRLPRTEPVPGRPEYNPPLVPVGYDFKSSPDYKRVQLYQTMTLRPNRSAELDKIVKTGLLGVDHYLKVSNATGVPWWVILCLHNMECDLSFRKHLHEGSPLTGRTRDDPKGCPKPPDPKGMPPFEWTYSAEDALRHDYLDKVTEWSLYTSLWKMEMYNGPGYWKYHPKVNSPYLWSGTNQFTCGKYVRDGKWDPNAPSDQIGCAAILKRMEEMQLVRIQQRPGS